MPPDLFQKISPFAPPPLPIRNPDYHFLEHYNYVTVLGKSYVHLRAIMIVSSPNFFFVSALGAGATNHG